MKVHETLDAAVQRHLNRRTFLANTGVGVGSFALSSLLSRSLVGKEKKGDLVDTASYRGLPGYPHIPPKVKRVIFLCMAGGPSHLESFDYKPALVELSGKPMPESFTKNQQLAQLQGKELTAQGAMLKMNQCGSNGQWVSELMPFHQKMIDELCVIKSMTSEQINHDPAHTFMNCGTQISGRPSMGAWVNYGLGAETDDLPGFVVLTSEGGRKKDQPIASRQWSSGCLPSRFQGVEFSATGDPVHYVSNPPGVPASLQRSSVQAIQQLDRNYNNIANNPEINARISAFETAFRMQTAVPDLMDMSKETAETFKMYGCTPGDGSFASNCLLARRLAEKGVRFIHLYQRGWDHHGNLKNDFTAACLAADQASYALIQDLKQRGMLDDTLVIWGGEFGRTPMIQGDKGTPGRDHHIKGFSMWMAGGGVKKGIAYGNTDELGYAAVENPVSVHDLHATMLHLLGIEHEKFTYRFQGLDLKLSGVEKAKVVKDILT
jgi:hypothetical protein